VVVQPTLPSPTEGIMPKSTTPNLNDTQLIILSSASQREDGLAVLPESLKASAAKTAVTKLLGLGFLKELRVKRDQPIWRNDEEDKPVGLKITKAGSAAIGVADEGAAEDEPAAEPKSRRKPKLHAPAETTTSREPRPGSKQAQIIALMRRKNGASLDDMVEATEWLPHTTRAALTGLRKKGYGIEKGKSPKGKTLYRIPAEDRSAPAGQQIA
jgi:Protein of unknown function (DUF3489)